MLSASVTPLFCTVTVRTLVRVSGSVNFGSLGENVLYSSTAQLSPVGAESLTVRVNASVLPFFSSTLMV